MKIILSKSELENHLNEIKDCIIKEISKTPKNISFLNSDAFYDYYKDKTTKSNISIEATLNIIEDYIPLAIKKNTLDIFLANCKAEDSPYILQSFLHSSKVEFIQLIDYSKNDKEKWNEVCILCESLRLKHLIDEKFSNKK